MGPNWHLPTGAARLVPQRSGGISWSRSKCRCFVTPHRPMPPTAPIPVFRHPHILPIFSTASIFSNQNSAVLPGTSAPLDFVRAPAISSELSRLLDSCVVLRPICTEIRGRGPALLPQLVHIIPVKSGCRLSLVTACRRDDFRFRPNVFVRFWLVGKVDILILQRRQLYSSHRFFACLSGCHPHPLHLGCSQSPE